MISYSGELNKWGVQGILKNEESKYLTKFEFSRVFLSYTMVVKKGTTLSNIKWVTGYNKARENALKFEKRLCEAYIEFLGTEITK